MYPRDNPKKHYKQVFLEYLFRRTPLDIPFRSLLKQTHVRDLKAIPQCCKTSPPVKKLIKKH